MLYEEMEKKEIERVYAVFADYIRESLYLEWFWSDKLGYLLLKIGAEKRYIAENVIIYTAEQLARILFSEVSMDVLQMTGNDHTEQTADPLELAEINREIVATRSTIAEIDRVLAQLDDADAEIGRAHV